MDNIWLCAAVQEPRLELVQHLSCLPDTVSSRNYLSPKIKWELSDHHFDSDDDVTATVGRWLEVKDADFYKEGILMLLSI